MKSGKTAICISGLLRTGIQAHKCFESLFSTLGEYDVFYHTWEITDEQKETVNSLYKPISSVIQAPISSSGSFGNSLYSMMMANELKKIHEINNSFRYDLVIKTRFDLAYSSRCRFPVMPIVPRTLYSTVEVSGFNHPDFESHGINDIIFWGDSETMDIATNASMYYRYEALPAFNTKANTDPEYFYNSVGILIYNKTIKYNIAHNRAYRGFHEIPWRDDVGHLDPFNEIELKQIQERYSRL